MKHHNCLITKSVIDYVEERDPSLVGPLLEDLNPELTGVSDVKSFLSDPNNWISSETLITLYDRVKTFFNN